MVIWSGDFASNFRVSNKISDHMALQVSLACKRPHPEKKEIYVRSLRRMDKDALCAGLSAICVNRECSNVHIVVSQYNKDLSKLLDKHAPQKKIQIVDRPLNDWINDDIQALKAIRRKREDIWRKNPIVVNFEIYQDSCTAVKNAIAESKTHVMQEKIAKTKGDQKEIFKLNNCMSDIRVWMIKNKLKINDFQKFILFRSPQAKQDLSGLPVSVDDSVIAQSSKVRDLGVIFDQFLKFDAVFVGQHIFI